MTGSDRQHDVAELERQRERRRLQEELAKNLGSELRQGREERGLGLEELAASLKLTASQLRALEDGDWAPLGAPVYVRGYVRSYGRLVGVDVSAADQWRYSETVEQPEHSPLSIQNRLPGRALRRSQRVASYLIATALVAVPVTLIVREAFDGSLFSKAQPALPERSAGQRDPGDDAASQTGAEAAPMLASMTPRKTRRDLSLPQPDDSEARLFAGSFEPGNPPEEPAAQAAVPPPPPRLRLALREDAWLEVTNAAGERLAYGLKAAGSELEFPIAAGIDARIGNAPAVTATLNGERFDLAPHMEADVADFSLAADGEPRTPDGD